MNGACGTYGEEEENRGGHLESVSLYGRIILKWILKKYGGRTSTKLIEREIRICGRSGEHDSETIGAMKCGEILC